MPRNGQTQRRRPWNNVGQPLRNIRLATINATTLNDKIEEVVEMMMERRLDILGICETRLVGEGRKTVHSNFELIFKGMEVGRKYGVAFVLAPEFADKIEKIDYVNERIISITIKLAGNKITLIQVYAPHQGRSQEEKEQFYQNLQDTIDTVDNGDKIIVGDLNAHVGTNRTGLGNVIGAFGIGDKNNEGENLTDFCVRNRLAIMNTFYKHQDSHKWSWYRWNAELQDYTDKSMIDLVLTNNKRMFRDVKCIPSVSLDSDHRLVVAKMSIKKPNTPKKLVRERIMVERLSIPEIARQYREKVSDAVPEENEETESIEHEWEKMKHKITEIAKEIIEVKKISGGKKKKTVWWTADVKTAVKRKNKTFRKWMRRRNALNRTEYEEARNVAERVKRKAKKDTWEKLGEELEQDMEGTRKLIYSIAKNYRRKEESIVNTIKDKEGELLTDTYEIDQRWKEYFSELLNPLDDNELLEESLEEVALSRGEMGDGITRVEIRDAIKKMKNGKSPGCDGIPAELLKGNEDIVDWLYRIFNVAWHEGRVPDDWCKAVICKIFKKGDRNECKNYRGITLLTHIGKIYERILEKRLRVMVEEKLEEGQYGFRPQRGTTELIFTLRMIMEKSWEWAKDIYIVFIDLEKAFDRVPRNNLWEILADPDYGVEPKLARAIKSLYRNCKSAVRTQQGEDNWFSVSTGVRQGGVISPLLFILYMDKIMKSLNNDADEIITLAYADDIALIANTPIALQRAVDNWNDKLKSMDMKINKNKTEIMVVSRERHDMEIKIEGVPLKLVENFKYLGVNVNEKCDMGTEINNRIGNYTKSLRLLYPLLKEKSIPTRVKVLIYKTILRPLLTYGSEIWTLTTKLKSRIQAAEMRVLRLIKGITRRDRRRNADVQEELDVEPILIFVERSQLRWYGHVMRMDMERYPLRYYLWTPRGTRPRGRPRKRWKDGIREAIATRGETMETIEDEERYSDRTQWRNFARHHN